jgi:UDP-N-acetylglucosamine acyltransferase
VIDPRAVVDPSARLAPDVTVGPFSVIGAGCGNRRRHLDRPACGDPGPTRIGCDNRIFQFASLGEMPQDKKYGGEPTRLEIGDRNTIREFVTINRGTVQDAGLTRLGDDNWIMAYVHIAHDCVVGNRTIFANGASLAGHVHIEDDVVLGGFALVYQFTRLGAHSFCGFRLRGASGCAALCDRGRLPRRTLRHQCRGLRRRGFPMRRFRRSAAPIK